MSRSGGISRRTLLRSAAGTAAVVALPSWRATARPYSRPLPLPRVLTGAHLKVPIVEAEVPILPGAPTRMWTFGGDFPGPLIRRPSGKETVVDFAHRLPRAAGELSVHLHGAHTPAKHDGQPGGLTAIQPRSLVCEISRSLPDSTSGNDLLIRPGERRRYRYPFVEAGEPARGQAHWYHDHRLDNTARNNWRGLQGLWIADDDFDAALPLPRDEREIPLVIGDRAFDRRNQLTDPFGEIGAAPHDQTTGRFILVNGALMPHHRVRGARYRLRVLNASSFRAYNLELSHGLALTQIGSDGGLLPKPVTRRRFLIGPGERLDLIADFSGVAHREVQLRSVPRRNGPKRLGSRPYAGPLMEFRVGARARGDRTEVPAELRPLPAWTAQVPDDVAHVWRMTVGVGLRPTWLLNGRTFDPAYSDHRVPLGRTERWRLVNATGVAHLLHLHHTSFVLLSRNGRPPSATEAGVKDTFFMDPGDKLEVAGHFSDFRGKYMVHCHMLDHEDHGLMAQFETV